MTFYVTSVPLCLSQTAHVKIRLPWKKRGVRLTLTETGAAQVQLQREGDGTQLHNPTSLKSRPKFSHHLTKQSESPEILSLSLCRLTDHLAVVIYSTQEQVHKFRKFIVLEEQYWDYSAFNSTETLYSTKWLQYSLLNTLISIFLHGRKNSLLFYSTPQHANPKT